MSTRPKKLNLYPFGNHYANSQDPDEPYDSSSDIAKDGVKLSGKGAQGGGSQRQTVSRGSATLTGSYPRHPQKIRG